MYSLLIDTLIKDAKEKDFLFNSINNIDSIKLKAEWAFRWIKNSENISLKLVAFACVEGILKF